MKKNLRLVSERELEDGRGFIFRTGENCIVLSADKILWDDRENKLRRKIGVSLSSGCGVGCVYCFTRDYANVRILTPDEIIEQVWYVLEHGFPKAKFDETKISYKQMGDPGINAVNTCEAIQEIHEANAEYAHVVSTAGLKSSPLFCRLRELEKEGVRLRLQFSCHTTSDAERAFLSPKLPLLTIGEIAKICNGWNNGKVTLNFMMIEGLEYDAEKVQRLFFPDKAFIKINFIDPNSQTHALGLEDMPQDKVVKFYDKMESYGFECAYRHRYSLV